MIDERYISNAREIRKIYEKLSIELDNNKKDLSNLTDFLKDKIDELNSYKTEIINRKVKTKEEVFDISKTLLKKMTEIEQKEKIISKKINEIGDKMNKIRKEEQDLLKILTDKYPQKSLEEIRSEIHSRL